MEGAEDAEQIPAYDIVAENEAAAWLFNWPPESLMKKTYTGKEVAKRRALQMARIRWTPENSNIPSRYGVYAKNKTYTGLPYSLTIKTDTHLGTQVSLYTFMTAVDNPLSLLYTEDLRKAPYYGSDCAPYYGTTCSNSVMFALGIDAPYYTYMIRSIPGIIKPKGQNPEDVEDCDILLKNGHVVMVFEVGRDDEGNLTDVKVFETTSADKKDTWIRDFSAEEFSEYYSSNTFVRLQYSLLDSNTSYEPSMFVPLEDEPGIDNYSPLRVCTTRGDKASYLAGEGVDIAVLAKGYRWVEVYKDDTPVERKVISLPLVCFKNLPYGLYKAYLVHSDGTRSPFFTSFEIIDAEVSGEKAGDIRVRFSSKNASPRYLCICDVNHNPYSYYQFSDADRESGCFETALVEGNRTTSFKVYFKGEYGVVATKIQRF